MALAPEQRAVCALLPHIADYLDDAPPLVIDEDEMGTPGAQERGETPPVAAGRRLTDRIREEAHRLVPADSARVAATSFAFESTAVP